MSRKAMAWNFPNQSASPYMHTEAAARGTIPISLPVTAFCTTAIHIALYHASHPWGDLSGSTSSPDRQTGEGGVEKHRLFWI